MNKQNLSIIATALLESTKNKLVELGGLPTAAVLIGKNHELSFVHLDLANKNACTQVIQHAAEAIHPDAVIMISEAWMEIRDVEGNIDSDISRGLNPERRVEVIVLCAKSAEAGIAQILEFIRLPGGSFTFKTPITLDEGFAFNRFLDGITFAKGATP